MSSIARLRQSFHLPTIQKIPSEVGRPMAELRPRLHSGIARPEVVVEKQLDSAQFSSVV